MVAGWDHGDLDPADALRMDLRLDHLRARAERPREGILRARTVSSGALRDAHAVSYSAFILLSSRVSFLRLTPHPISSGPPSWGPAPYYGGGKGGKSGGYDDDDYSPWSPPFWGPPSWGPGPSYGGKGGKSGGYDDDDYSPWSPPSWGPPSWGPPSWGPPSYGGGKSGKTKGY